MEEVDTVIDGSRFAESLKVLRAVHADDIEISKQRLVAAEGELRRAPIAFNGAGLIAVISLFHLTGMPGVTLHIAAWIYFAGLCLAVFAWTASRDLGMKVLSIGPTLHLIEAAWDEVLHSQSADELNAHNSRMERGIEKVKTWRKGRERAEGPMRSLSVTAFALFFGGTLTLLVGT
jgi:hypothetical protein